MSDSSITASLLQHFLATLAYRTQKALREAPESFGKFRAAPGVRTPIELVRHMTGVLGYARTFYVGGQYAAEPLPTMGAEVERFHEMLGSLAAEIGSKAEPDGVTELQLLQGPLSDAMTHVGQIAMLRRLALHPVPPENFLRAHISAERLGTDQAPPAAYGNRYGTWDP